MEKTHEILYRRSKGSGSLGKRAIVKAKTPDQTRIMYRNSVYSFFDAFLTKSEANNKTHKLRTLEGRTHAKNYTKAIVVDLGEDAGRLRYAVFVAKGRKI